MTSVTHIVVDTSVFSNPDTRAAFGETTHAALETFVRLADGARPQMKFFVPPSVQRELKTFVPDGHLPANFELAVTLRSPSRLEMLVPGQLLYELIDDIRTRIDRGLRVAEQAVRETDPKDLDRKINRLREKYRDALRSGLLDSKEDVDLILLARQLDAALVSSDRAVMTWAEKLGIRLINPHVLREVMEAAHLPPGSH